MNRLALILYLALLAPLIVRAEVVLQPINATKKYFLLLQEKESPQAPTELRRKLFLFGQKVCETKVESNDNKFEILVGSEILQKSENAEPYSIYSTEKNDAVTLIWQLERETIDREVPSEPDKLCELKIESSQFQKLQMGYYNLKEKNFPQEEKEKKTDLRIYFFPAKDASRITLQTEVSAGVTHFTSAAEINNPRSQKLNEQKPFWIFPIWTGSLDVGLKLKIAGNSSFHILGRQTQSSTLLSLVDTSLHPVNFLRNDLGIYWQYDDFIIRNYWKIGLQNLQFGMVQSLIRKNEPNGSHHLRIPEQSNLGIILGSTFYLDQYFFFKLASKARLVVAPLSLIGQKQSFLGQFSFELLWLWISHYRTSIGYEVIWQSAQLSDNYHAAQDLPTEIVEKKYTEAIHHFFVSLMFDI